MKKLYFSLLTTAALPLSATAEQTFSPDLTKVAEKVDTDGDFLTLNRVESDLKAYKKYISLLVKAAQDKDPEGATVKEQDVSDFFEALGFNNARFSAASSKKVDEAWINKYYVWTEGSQKGLFSLFGKKNERAAVVDFAPESTDLAVQMRVDLRQFSNIMANSMKLFGASVKSDELLHEKQEELGDLTLHQLLSKVNARVSLAVDIDRENNRIQPQEGIDLPGAQCVARIDGVAWAWGLFGDKIIKDSGLPWVKKEEGKVTTYTLSPDNAELKKAMQGYEPIIRVDVGKNLVWIASKPNVLKEALSDGKKLKDSVVFKKAMEGMPKASNSLIYISPDLLKEGKAQYELMKKNNLMDPGFENVEPLFDDLVADVSKTPSGVVVKIDVDDNGIQTIIKCPFALKDNHKHITPYAAQIGFMYYFMFQMRVQMNGM